MKIKRDDYTMNVAWDSAENNILAMRTGPTPFYNVDQFPEFDRNGGRFHYQLLHKPLGAFKVWCVQ